MEGADLKVIGCYFHDNEDGLLCGENLNSSIEVYQSEFAYNGYGDGQSHNMYIGRIKNFKLEFSYSHHAKIGHNVKSRAENNFIEYNRIMDEKDGTSSYAIDLPNGGLSYIIGNNIQQGPEADNSIIISYGAEGLKNDQNEVYVVNNTIVNDRHYGIFIRVNNSTKKAILANNLLIGKGEVSNGPVDKITNLHISAISGLKSILEKAPGFVDVEHFDYRIQSGSAAIDKGSTLQPVHNTSLIPKWSYEHPLKGVERNIQGPIDIGAYEFNK